METTTIQLNDHTVATVLLDPSPQDPRGFSPADDLIEGYAVYDVNRAYSNEKMDWFRTFRDIYLKINVDVALRSMDILRSMGVQLPAYIGVRGYSGYSQSDWANFVISGPTEEAAESYYQTFAAWLRGDVFGIQLERKCPVTGGWFTAENEDAVFGFYWDGSDLEAFVRAEAESNWDLDAQPISEAGNRAKQRDGLDSKIGAKLQAFFDLEESVGASPLSDIAREIFTLYSELGEEYLIELEELN